MTRLTALLAAVIALRAATAWGCASCSCGDTTLTAMGVEMPFRHRVRLSLEERLSGHAIGEAETFERSWSLRSTLGGSWSPTSWWTVAATVPLVATWTQGANRVWRDLVGLGDAEAMTRFIVYRDRAFGPRHLIGLTAGLKLPTGPRVNDSGGYPAPEDDQPGSASWDPFGAASYTYFGDNYALFGSATVRWTTEGRRGYRRGESLGATVGAQLQPWSWGAVALAADARWSAAATLPGGDAAPNSGGALIAITPSLIAQPIQDWQVRLSLQLPVVERWNGLQGEYPSLILSTVIDL